METIGTRIRARRVQLGITPKDLARQVGIAYSTLMDIENGRTLEPKNPHRFAEALGLSVRFLETGRDESHALRTVAARLGSLNIAGDGVGETRGDYMTLPLLDFALDPRSTPSADAQAKAQQLRFSQDFAKARGWTPHTHFLALAPTDGMAPTIERGAPVVVNISQTTVQSGRVHALLVDGDLVLARLDRLGPGRVRVRYDNPSPLYAPCEVADSDLHIIGRAVWTAAEL
jgi:transcriptional regulator with XRE-family HTH domain